MATKEFTALNHLGQETKFTPKPVTYNGQRGFMWTRSALVKGVWVFQGQKFHDGNATRATISGYSAQES
jgi:hypothetical protein